MAETYPEPHRDANGKIIIENSLLYKEDIKKYGAYQTMQWVKQGKYNLTPEELYERKKGLEKFINDYGYYNCREFLQRFFGNAHGSCLSMGLGWGDQIWVYRSDKPKFES